MQRIAIARVPLWMIQKVLNTGKLAGGSASSYISNQIY